MLLGILFFIGIMLDILISIFVTGRRDCMGIIVFCVLILNVLIQVCGGSDRWGE
jgi:hypothetical protein